MQAALIRAVAAALALFVVTGCDGAPPSEPASPGPPAAGPSTAGNAPPPPATALPAPQSLAGEYRVAGVDGAAIEGQVGFAVSITANRISFEPTCLGSVWAYSYSRGRLSTARDANYGPQVQPDGSSVTCLVMPPQGWNALTQAIDTASRVEGTREGGILFTGGGHSVLLFTQ